MQHLTPDQRKLLSGSFVRMDINNDGVVTIDELFKSLCEYFPNVDPAELADITSVIFDTADRNGDGALDLEEFYLHFGGGMQASDIANVPNKQSLSIDERDFLRDAFIRLDTDGDGVLSFTEIVQAANSVLGQERLEAVLPILRELFVIADKDKDDRLTLLEFLASFVDGAGVLPEDVVGECVASVRIRLTDEQILALQRNFATIDQDHDGLISAEELEAVLRAALTADESLTDDDFAELTQMIMEVVDRDGDGRLNLSEFIRSFQEDQGLLPPLLVETRAEVVKVKHAHPPPPSTTENSNVAYDDLLRAICRCWTDVLGGKSAPFTTMRGALRETLSPFFSSEEALVGAVNDILKAAERDGAGNLDLTTLVNRISGPERPPKQQQITNREKLTAGAVDREETIRQACKVFAALDEDQDGYLRLQDLVPLTMFLVEQRNPNWTEKNVRAVSEAAFCAADLDDDGRISEAEFAKSFIDGYPVLPLDFLKQVSSRLILRLSEAEMSRITDAFCAIDANHDGFVSRDELGDVLRGALGEIFTGDQSTVSGLVDVVMSKVDGDHDGKLSFSEFVRSFELDQGVLRVPLLAAERRVLEEHGVAKAVPTSPPKSQVTKLQSSNPPSISDVDVRNLTFVFRLLDADVDGYISIDDVREPVSIWLRRQNPSWPNDKVERALQVVFSAADIDRDAKLSLGEFVGSFVSGYGLFPPAAVKEMTELRTVPRERSSAWTALAPTEVAVLRKVFDTLDLDRNGALDAGEIQAAVIDALGGHAEGNSLDRAAVQGTVDSIIEAMDINGDQKITFDEFLQAFEAMQAASPPSSPTSGSIRDRVRKADAALAQRLNAVQLRTLAKNILDVDVDKNGLVVVDEFGSAIKSALAAAGASPEEQERTVALVLMAAEMDARHDSLTLEPFITHFVNKYFVQPPTADGAKPELDHHLTAEEIEELKTLFRAIDENNDGSIQAEEFERLLTEALEGTKLANNERTVSAVVASVMSAADTNGDGQVSFREFLGAFEKDPKVLDLPIMAAAARMETAQRRMEALLCEHDLRNLARVFLFLDKNGDGFLQPAELRGAMLEEFAAAHPEWPQERLHATVEALLQAADVNGDGRLSLDEFIDAFLDGHYVLPPRYIRDVVMATSRPLTDEEVSQIKALFQSIDVNSDGFVTGSELINSLTPVVGRATAEAVCGAIMLVADENQDGRLTLNEFLQAYQIDNGILYVPISAVSHKTVSSIASKLCPTEKLRELSRFFGQVDANHDGFLDIDEVFRYIQDHPEGFGASAAGSGADPLDEEGLIDQCRAKLLQADIDMDSRLSLDEFVSAEVQGQSVFPPGFVNRMMSSMPRKGTSDALLTPPAPSTGVPAGLSVTQVSVDVNTPQASPSKQPSPPAQPKPEGSTRRRPNRVTGVAVEEDELRDEFDRYDVDKNGFLSFAEFKKAYKNMETYGVPMSDAQMDKLFAPFAHADGKLSFDEFCILMLRRSRM